MNYTSKGTGFSGAPVADYHRNAIQHAVEAFQKDHGGEKEITWYDDGEIVIFVGTAANNCWFGIGAPRHAKP